MTLAEALKDINAVPAFAMNELYNLREAVLRLMRPDTVTTTENGVRKTYDERANDASTNSRKCID